MLAEVRQVREKFRKLLTWGQPWSIARAVSVGQMWDVSEHPQQTQKQMRENSPSKVDQMYAINGTNFQQLMTNPQWLPFIKGLLHAKHT